MSEKQVIKRVIIDANEATASENFAFFESIPKPSRTALRMGM